MSRVFRKQADVASDCITYNKLNYESLYLDIDLVPNQTGNYELDLDKFVELKLANRCDKVCVYGIFTFALTTNKPDANASNIDLKIKFYRDEERTQLAFVQPYLEPLYGPQGSDVSRIWSQNIEFCELVPLAITEDTVKYYITIEAEFTNITVVSFELAQYSLCAEEASNCDNLCCNTCSTHKCYSSTSKSCDASVFCNQSINRPIIP